MFAPDELIAALADAGVEYVLIGGLAVGAHGFPRATKDVDIVPAPEPSNLQRLAALLRALDARHHGMGDFDPSEFPFDPHDPKQLGEGGNFVLTTRLGRLDVMQWVPGIPGERAFEHLARAAVDTTLNGRRVRTCSRDDLIAMKRAAGRPQDLVDLQELGA
ncbi:MAG TPA: hypothetical protein VFG79_01470 [Solirubrobacter sp.]|jgi:hypothetical protein|nr:hypothetical protein [Solirubrobacter sp.]